MRRSLIRKTKQVIESSLMITVHNYYDCERFSYFERQADGGWHINIHKQAAVGTNHISQRHDDIYIYSSAFLNMGKK